MKQSSLSKSTSCEVLDFTETKCLAGTEGHSSCGGRVTLAHSLLLHRREPVGFSL